MQTIVALLLLATAANADMGQAKNDWVAMLQAKGKEGVTPVEKVIQLLQGMVEKGKKDKADEATEYNTFKQWCDETTVEKTRRIEEANSLIETLTADIQKYEADAALLTKEIAEHDEDISTWQNDIKAATGVREIEKADYDAEHKDYTESIDALERAIQVIKDSAKDVAFVQVSNLNKLNLIPDDAKKAIDAFFQDEDEFGLSDDQPATAAYEHKSQGIIDMLEKLLNRFEGILAPHCQINIELSEPFSQGGGIYKRSPFLFLFHLAVLEKVTLDLRPLKPDPCLYILQSALTVLVRMIKL